MHTSFLRQLKNPYLHVLYEILLQGKDFGRSSIEPTNYIEPKRSFIIVIHNSFKRYGNVYTFASSFIDPTFLCRKVLLKCFW